MAESHDNPSLNDTMPSPGSRDLDRMEDDFYVLCAAIRRECDESMRREAGHEEENFSVCQKATSRYDAEAVPAFDEIVRIAGKDSPACRRARERAASCLHGLALNHVWADRRDIAESLTQRAKELAPEGSLVLSRIEDTVFSPGAIGHGVKNISVEDQAVEHEHTDEHEKSHSAKGYGVWIAASIGLVFGIAVVVYTGKDVKQAPAPAPLHVPEKSAVASAPKEDVVAKTITESVTNTAPPSTKDSHLKQSEEKAKPVHDEVKKAAAPAQSKVVAQPEPVRTAPAKTVVAQPQPAKTAPAKTVVAQPEPVRTAPAKTVVAQPQPAKTAPAKTEVHQGRTKVKESKKKVAEPTAKPRVVKSSDVKKTPVDANESRAMTLGTLLVRTEAKLNKLLKDLENKEAQIASRRSTLEVYEQKKGTDSADYRKIGEEYNRLIREYNKQLAEANKVAEEHEALLKEYRQLVGSQNN